MALYTLAEALEFYETAKKAYLNALTNKRYDVPSRSKENQSIKELKKEMDYWSGVVLKLKSGSGSNMQVKRIIPHV